MSDSIRELRDRGTDQTLQNMLRALTLNLELRGRYRVFEFEAKQDGRPEVAELFGGLRRREDEPITELMDGLRDQLDQLRVPGSTEGVS